IDTRRIALDLKDQNSASERPRVRLLAVAWLTPSRVWIRSGHRTPPVAWLVGVQDDRRRSKHGQSQRLRDPGREGCSGRLMPGHKSPPRDLPGAGHCPPGDLFRAEHRVTFHPTLLPAHLPPIETIPLPDWLRSSPLFRQPPGLDGGEVLGFPAARAAGTAL